jgi:hypothetical protein
LFFLNFFFGVEVVKKDWPEFWSWKPNVFCVGSRNQRQITVSVNVQNICSN